MKRLRAPDSDSKAASPAAGAPADPTAVPQASDDPSVPSSMTLSEGAPAAAHGGAEITPAEPQQPYPLPQDAQPASRCNGDVSALDTGAQAGDEQG